MKDIKVTEDNRFVIKNGDFETVDGVDRIKQDITTAVRGILPGTWFPDPRIGINWFSGLAVYTSILKAQVKNAIDNVWGVNLLRNYVFDDSNSDEYKVSGIVFTDNENLNFDEVISWK